MHYEDASFFTKGGRPLSCEEGGFWWIEIGIPWNTLYDNEVIRHELTRHALGVWDYMKNRDPVMSKLCKNRVLDFIGQVPGKRESRRIMGRYLLNEHDIQERKVFTDEVAYGGWFIDLHTPGGLLADTSEPAAALERDPRLKEVAYKYVGPYGIPLSCLQSKDVHNLQMAGRNISTTHAALGTVRVMATCGTMGHAVGIAAAKAAKSSLPLGSVKISDLQQALLRDNCFLPNYGNQDPEDLARHAKAEASSSRTSAGLSTWHKDHADERLRDYMRSQGFDQQAQTDSDLCQWCFLSTGPLDKIGVHLVNQEKSKAVVQVAIRPVTSLWDYEKNGEPPIWSGEAELDGETDEMLWLQTSCEITHPGAYRIEIQGPGHVAWRYSGEHDWGLASGHLIGSGRYKWSKYREFAFRLDPPQKVYGPEQVLSGITRPQKQSNAWFSSAALPFPQHLTLSWPEPVPLQTIAVTFTGQIVFEPRFEDPYYLPPNLAKRYRLQVPDGQGGWHTVHLEENNLETRKVHTLQTSVTTDQLRILIEATHGSTSAGIIEVRCYE
jgi:hypothetical protein